MTTLGVSFSLPALRSQEVRIVTDGDRSEDFGAFGQVEGALRADIERHAGLQHAPRALIETALALARALDDGTQPAATARELRAALHELFGEVEQAPAGGGLDDLQARRAARRAGATG
ncbi:hypothetical protein [Goodfellowiella coeruleoviolacea]|uniref:hypothetical protein n=1 Tax=Goodfellowiella coeruleoviolacea TaxID=334858 RepID=UPI0020A28C0F|nr:hypothetical protein [Goodfellowiella coeruleoviolacea]